MGVAEFLKADMVKPGVVVMDVGVNRVPDAATSKTGTKLVGDVDFKTSSPSPARSPPIRAGSWAHDHCDAHAKHGAGRRKISQLMTLTLENPRTVFA